MLGGNILGPAVCQTEPGTPTLPAMEMSGRPRTAATPALDPSEVSGQMMTKSSLCVQVRETEQLRLLEEGAVEGPDLQVVAVAGAPVRSGTQEVTVPLQGITVAGLGGTVAGTREPKEETEGTTAMAGPRVRTTVEEEAEDVLTVFWRLALMPVLEPVLRYSEPALLDAPNDANDKLLIIKKSRVSLIFINLLLKKINSTLKESHCLKLQYHTILKHSKYGASEVRMKQIHPYILPNSLENISMWVTKNLKM